MNKQTIFVTFIAFVFGVMSTVIFINSELDDQTINLSSDETTTGMHRMPDGSVMPNQLPETNMMMGDMDHSTMMVTSEREFIAGMIPHHQEAIDTAEEVLVRGGSTPEMRQLAEDIIVAQTAEIADMKRWYEDWYGTPYEASDGYTPMMRELTNLSGAELDRIFLEDMIMHHMGAIMMARSVQPYIEHEEITTLTQAIIASQSAEIARMRQLLQDV